MSYRHAVALYDKISKITKFPRKCSTIKLVYIFMIILSSSEFEPPFQWKNSIAPLFF